MDTPWNPEEASLAEGDDQRVESRLAAIGRGFSATPERIEALRQQAERLHRVRTGPPARAFGSVLGSKRSVTDSADVDEESQPEVGQPTGPKPSLSHPRQQDQFALGKKKTTVILKG